MIEKKKVQYSREDIDFLQEVTPGGVTSVDIFKKSSETASKAVSKVCRGTLVEEKEDIVVKFDFVKEKQVKARFLFHFVYSFGERDS